jgi:hypothetical protein
MVTQELRQKYGKIENGKEDSLYKQHKNLQKEYNKRRMLLQRDHLAETREKFFRGIDSVEIRNQLMDEEMAIACPHPCCAVTLSNVNHFKNHAQIVHGISL